MRSANSLLRDDMSLTHAHVIDTAHPAVHPPAPDSGRMRVPLDRIDTFRLVRDRARGQDPELSELIRSIRDVGLSNPIRVVPCRDGRFELVEGYRRLCAFRQLLAETGDRARYASIPVGLAQTDEATGRLYRRMVDENMVRKSVSFAELALLAIHYAADPTTTSTDADGAINELFGSAGHQKRSYVRQFVRLMSAIGDTLRYPGEVSRALGLQLAQRMEEDPGLARAIREELADWDTRTVADELLVLRRVAGAELAGGEVKSLSSSGGQARGPRLTFQISTPAGPVTCNAADGRLEVRAARDFSLISRRKLEEALSAMLDRIGLEDPDRAT